MQSGPSADVQVFVTGWVARHVRALPAETNVPLAVDRLAAKLTCDAREEGISGRDLHRTIGDIDDYLTVQYLAHTAAD
jgi:hypothetical protein